MRPPRCSRSRRSSTRSTRRASSSTRSRASRAPAASRRRARTRASCSRTSRPTASARISTRPEIAQALGLPGLLRAPPAARTPWPARDLLRAPGRPTLRGLLEAAYATSPVVRVLPEGVAPELARVQGTDAAEIGVFEDRATGTAIVVCALDNLGKGAAGQAVQNANLALGLDETLGPPARRSARMSVTAAKGFVASGVHSGIRQQEPRSRPRALARARNRRGDVHREPRAGGARRRLAGAPRARRAAGGRRSTPASRTRPPGERGQLDALATAAEAGAAPRPRRRGGARPLDRRDRRAAAARERSLAGLRAAAAELSGEGGADAAAGDHDDRHEARRKPAAHGTGFTVGGMAKGSGMIHPDLATMLAVVTTDYPLEPGEAIEFLRPAVDASFNAISVDGECSTNDTVILLANGACGIERTPATRRELRGRAARGVRRARRADRRRRRGRDGPRRDRGHAARRRHRRRRRSRGGSRPRRS